MVDDSGAGTVETRRVGPYRLEGRLGAGGMGEVFRGYDERLDRPVALKRVPTSRSGSSLARRRLRREARAMARVHHPAIAQIHDWVEAEDGDWFVMELVSGETLRHVIEAGAPLPWQQAARFAVEIAAGLRAAHEAGLVHRDLKPANVMVTESGRVKILDFGLAKARDAVAETSDGDPTLTRDGELVGTVSAMSPEQALGLAVDPRTDLFALGTLLYEMLTGRPPFRAATPVQTLARICNRPPDPLRSLAPETPEELAVLVDHLLEKEADQRPESAGEVIERLAALPGLVAGPETDSISFDVTEAMPAPHRRAPSRVGGSTSSGRSSERRRMAVLVADLVTDPSQGDDPELLIEGMPDFQALAADAVERHGGHVESRLGHRLVACFGHPVARADDASQAMRAALAILTRATNHPALDGLAVRALVHAGPVVVLTDGDRDLLVLGETLDRTLAMLGKASGSGVLASPEARRLAGEDLPFVEGPSVRLDDDDLVLFRPS